MAWRNTIKGHTFRVIVHASAAHSRVIFASNKRGCVNVFAYIQSFYACPYKGVIRAYTPACASVDRSRRGKKNSSLTFDWFAVETHLDDMSYGMYGNERGQIQTIS